MKTLSGQARARKRQKQEEAASRLERYQALTTEKKIAHLDFMGYLAKKQRARLA